jgi:hypothetical protein
MNKDLYTQKIDFFNEELEKIHTILSDFTNRIGVLLTVAGLLSFLPQLVVTNHEYLTHFLSWTFWILLLSIVIYYPASLRVSSIIKGRSFASSGSDLELKILENRVEHLKLVWERSVEIHDRVVSYNRWSTGLIYAYMVSLTLNFYIFVFYGKPDWCISIIVLIGALLTAFILTELPKNKSEKNKIINKAI